MLPTTPSTGAFRGSFFTLPLELRERIYDELFQGVSLAWLNPDIRPKLGVTLHFFYEFNGSDEHGNLPQWLLTCKQIHDEALTQWYRGASCSPCFCGPNGGKTNPNKWTAEFCDIWRVQSFDGPVLDTPREAERDHELWLGTVPTDNIPGRPGGSRTRNITDARVLVPRMSEHLVPYSIIDCFFKYIQENKDLPAKQIKLSITAPSYGLYCGNAPPSVDLSYFELLGPRFDRIVFKLAKPDVGISRTPVTYLCAQREAVRVAKYLVGRKGNTGWNLRDYLLPFQLNGRAMPDNGVEWCVEVTRQVKQQSGELRYEGLEKCQLLTPAEAEDESKDNSPVEPAVLGYVM